MTYQMAFKRAGYAVLRAAKYTWLLVLLALMLAPAGALASYKLVDSWGSYGSGAVQFKGPQGLAADSKGNVYVADTGNDRIQVLGPKGNLVTMWGSKGQGNDQFDQPTAVAVAFNGYVFVADKGNGRVKRFTSSGTFNSTSMWKNAKFDQPLALALALYKTGTIAVFVLQGSPIDPKVFVYDSMGNYADKWGGNGPLPGKFYQPRGVAADGEGDVYVADTGHGWIQRFNLTGNFVEHWGGFGKGEGQFESPRGIAVDGDGSILVTDFVGDRVQRFDRNGNFVEQWGGPGILNEPTGVAAGPNGKVYVLDTGNNRVQVFESEKPVTSGGQDQSGGSGEVCTKDQLTFGLQSVKNVGLKAIAGKKGLPLRIDAGVATTARLQLYLSKKDAKRVKLMGPLTQLLVPFGTGTTETKVVLSKAEGAKLKKLLKKATKKSKKGKKRKARKSLNLMVVMDVSDGSNYQSAGSLKVKVVRKGKIKKGSTSFKKVFAVDGC